MVENQRQALKVLQYVYNTKTALNFGALFADGTDSYRHPAELKIGDSVTLRFRTGRRSRSWKCRRRLRMTLSLRAMRQTRL